MEEKFRLSSLEELAGYTNSEGLTALNKERLLLYHTGSIVEPKNIDVGHWGSELGYGFYMSMAPRFAVMHGRGSYINIYSISIDQLNNSNILFTTQGSSFVRANGGQVLLKYDSDKYLLTHECVIDRIYSGDLYTFNCLLVALFGESLRWYSNKHTWHTLIISNSPEMEEYRINKYRVLKEPCQNFNWEKLPKVFKEWRF